MKTLSKIKFKSHPHWLDKFYTIVDTILTNIIFLLIGLLIGFGLAIFVLYYL